jgi:hypothetical protein
MGKLNVWLHDNILTEDPNDYFGKIKSAGTVGNNEIAALMTKEGIELKEETILDILTRADRIKAERLAAGYSINTSFCNAYPKISGIFNSATEKYNKDKHKIGANISVGSLTRTELAKAEVDILGEATVEPVIGSVTDSLTMLENSTITPNNVIKIKGNRIKVAGEGPEIGVWLINQADNSRTQCTQLIANNPKEVMAMVPALAAGEYILEIVTQYSTGILLKNSRTSSFEQILIVA